MNIVIFARYHIKRVDFTDKRVYLPYKWGSFNVIVLDLV
jgi:hypothetical protein